MVLPVGAPSEPARQCTSVPLAEAYLWVMSEGEMAVDLWVDLDVVHARLATLAREEHAWIDAVLARQEDSLWAQGAGQVGSRRRVAVVAAHRREGVAIRTERGPTAIRCYQFLNSLTENADAWEHAPQALAKGVRIRDGDRTRRTA